MRFLDPFSESPVSRLLVSCLFGLADSASIEYGFLSFDGARVSAGVFLLGADFGLTSPEAGRLPHFRVLYLFIV